MGVGAHQRRRPVSMVALAGRSVRHAAFTRMRPSCQAANMCQANDDTLKALGPTTVDGGLRAAGCGLRVDYQFSVFDRATWTHVHRPVLRQFGNRAAGAFCLPTGNRTGDGNGYDWMSSSG